MESGLNTATSESLHRISYTGIPSDDDVYSASAVGSDDDGTEVCYSTQSGGKTLFRRRPLDDNSEVPGDLRAFYGHPLNAAASDSINADGLALLHEYRAMSAIDKYGRRQNSMEEVTSYDSIGRVSDDPSPPSLAQGRGISSEYPPTRGVTSQSPPTDFIHKNDFIGRLADPEIITDSEQLPLNDDHPPQNLFRVMSNQNPVSRRSDYNAISKDIVSPKQNSSINLVDMSNRLLPFRTSVQPAYRFIEQNKDMNQESRYQILHSIRTNSLAHGSPMAIDEFRQRFTDGAVPVTSTVEVEEYKSMEQVSDRFDSLIPGQCYNPDLLQTIDTLSQKPTKKKKVPTATLR